MPQLGSRLCLRRHPGPALHIRQDWGGCVRGQRTLDHVGGDGHVLGVVLVVVDGQRLLRDLGLERCGCIQLFLVVQTENGSVSSDVRSAQAPVSSSQFDARSGRDAGDVKGWSASASRSWTHERALPRPRGRLRRVTEPWSTLAQAWVH